MWRLVRHLKDIGITADDAAHMTDAAWLAASRAAQVTAPSDLSRRLVVQMLAGSASPLVRDPASADHPK